MTFVYTITAAGVAKTIAEIQGTGAASPFDGQNVQTQGVVTASYPTGGLNGFYIQTPGADTADASDAIFVYGGTDGFTTYPAVGASVEVSGEADEFFGATQIIATQSGVTSIASLGTVTAKTVIPGTECALPGTDCLTGAALDSAREVVEGELFQPTAPWTVTDSYDGSPNLNTNGSNDGSFRGELAVAASSSKPLVAPTEIIDAQATAAINDRKSTTRPSGSSSTTPRAGPTPPRSTRTTRSRGSPRPTTCAPARRSPSPSRSSSPTASTPGGSCRRRRSSATPPARSTSRRPVRLPPRTWAATSSWRRSTC